MPAETLRLVTNLSPGPLQTRLFEAGQDCQFECSTDTFAQSDQPTLCVWQTTATGTLTGGEPELPAAAPSLACGVTIRVAAHPTTPYPAEYFTTWHPEISDGDLRAWLRAAGEYIRVLREQQRQATRIAQWKTRELIGASPAMERVRQQVIASAGQQWPVLVVGEAGTGRELAARLVHFAGDQGHRPCLRIDCRVMTASLFQQELCGVESSQGPAQPGRLEQCVGGTLFFHELQELSQPCQDILAGIIQQGYYTPLGSHRRLPLDVRFSASATAGGFELASQNRLHPALAGFWSSPSIELPPLREHASDITLLVEHLLQIQSLHDGLPARRLMQETLDLLLGYDWPGNVSELQTVLNRACGASASPRLTPELVAPWLGQSAATASHLTLAEMERQLIEATFARFGGNRERTAQALQIGLRTLSGKLRDYGYPPRGGPNSKREAAERRAA